jgi:serine/threonine protein kinase
MSDAEPISELLLRWDELREQGREVTAAELCRDCPDLAPELARRIEVLRAVYRVPNAAAVGAPTLAEGPAEPVRRVEIPGYEILGTLGSGGMGVVYRARDLRLKRTVALKMILGGRHATAAQRARFKTEAEASARLQHPNIVQVFEVGEHEGTPYLALEFVDGGTLAEASGHRPWRAAEAAALVQALAQAVHHAHQRGVVHRDLKPANVLLSFSREPEASAPATVADALASGSRLNGASPKITDFGLAKQLDAAEHLTKTAAVLGTPSYMAPEQASGGAEPIGPWTDVWALGAILYELLTGRPPFQAASLLETLEQVRTVDPVPPRFLVAQLPVDLETICLKCLQKEPSQRYASAQALADDLGRLLAGESIQARSVNLLDHLTRLLNRAQFVGRPRPVAARVMACLIPVPLLGQLALLAVAGERPFYAAATLGLTLLTGLLLFAAVFRLNQTGALVTPVATNRQLWSVRIGVLAGMVVMIAVCAQVALPDRPGALMLVYPCSAVLAGTGLFSLGGVFWGRLYVLGLLFFGAALLMPLWLEGAAVTFNLCVSLLIVVLTLRLRQWIREGTAAPSGVGTMETPDSLANAPVKP